MVGRVWQGSSGKARREDVEIELGWNYSLLLICSIFLAGIKMFFANRGTSSSAHGAG